jgi:hypothetical protein
MQLFNQHKLVRGSLEPKSTSSASKQRHPLWTRLISFGDHWRIISFALQQRLASMWKMGVRMPVLDFKEIPEAHVADGMQDTFELFLLETSSASWAFVSFPRQIAGPMVAKT